MIKEQVVGAVMLSGRQQTVRGLEGACYCVKLTNVSMVKSAVNLDLISLSCEQADKFIMSPSGIIQAWTGVMKL